MHLLAFSLTRPSGLSGAKTVAYIYDADGNRASLTDPNGSVIAYSHTPRGQVASIVADGPPPLATFAYDAADRRTSRTLKNVASLQRMRVELAASKLSRARQEVRAATPYSAVL